MPPDADRWRVVIVGGGMKTAYERAVDLFRDCGSKIVKASPGVLVQCPAHDDNNPSLHLTDGGGKVLMYCHAGCAKDDILAELGWTIPDLFDTPRPIYQYPDRKVTRYYTADGEKHFHQRGHRKDQPTQLYRLDRLEPIETVYLVEGEEDVHALETLGLTATTAPMGAISFSKCDVSPLYGKTVIAVVDNDKRGDEWADQVRAALEDHCTLTFRQAAKGKDAADHIAAGLSVDELKPYGPDDVLGRHIVLTSAADIKPRRVKWLWQGRLALGTLGLLAGREGLGKSSLVYWLTAQITRGTLPGEYLGQPRAVLVCATEDSWEHTIVPRLMAVNADLARVFRVEVMSADGIAVGLSLPRDLHQMEESAKQTGAAMLVLDPLMSRLAETLDSHKDGEVRRALEPLVAIADRTNMAILGLMHHNKSGSTDPLQLVMGSKAFTAVARSVHTVVPDPEDETETRRLFGTPKNNLGSTNLSTLAFTMAPYAVETDEGTAWTAKVVWGSESTVSINDAMRQGAADHDTRTAVSEALDWLTDYIEVSGGVAASADIKRAGAKAGHADHNLKRARQRLGLAIDNVGKPRVTFWRNEALAGPMKQSEHQSEQSARGELLTVLTVPNRDQEPLSEQLEQSEQLERDPARGVPTDRCQKCGGKLYADDLVLGHGRCWGDLTYAEQKAAKANGKARAS